MNASEHSNRVGRVSLPGDSARCRCAGRESANNGFVRAGSGNPAYTPQSLTPVGRLPSAGVGRGTSSPGAWLVALLLLVGGVLAIPTTRAATAQADSPSFLLNTIGMPISIGGTAEANSGVFALDTRPYWGPFFAGSSADSGTFTVDTRGGSAVSPSSVIALHPTARYSPSSRTLTLTARAIDPLYGDVTQGTFSWIMDRAGASTVASGVATYQFATRNWVATHVFETGLEPGSYPIRFNLTSDRGRTGSKVLTMMLGAGSAVVNGLVKESAGQTPLSGAQVALFRAGGTGGLWTLVNAEYGGVIPPLNTLLSRLTPVRPTVTTSTDGAFYWGDVPVGDSYVIVAERAGYLQQHTASFTISAAGATVTRNLILSATEPTLAALAPDVNAVRAQLELLMQRNAEIMATVAEQYYADDIYSSDVDLFNLLGDLTSAVSLGFESLPAASGEVGKQVFKEVTKNVVIEVFAKQAPKQAIEELEGWCLRNAFPATKLGYIQSEVHRIYAGRLSETNSLFQVLAEGRSLPNGFSHDRALACMQLFIDDAARVSSDFARYLPSPRAEVGIYGFSLDNMSEEYMRLSRILQGLKTTEKVLSGVQIVGGGIVIVGVLTGGYGGVGVPVMAVAAKAKTAAGWGKRAIYLIKLEHKPHMAVH